MSLANCSLCGKTYNKLPGHKMCPACQAEEEAQFDRVYQYLRDNPGTTIPVISGETKVSERAILEWFRAGRLLSSSDGVQWPCEHCGVQISRGRLCRPCGENMQGTLKARTDGVTGRSSGPAPGDPSGRSSSIGHELRSDRYAH